MLSKIFRHRKRECPNPGPTIWYPPCLTEQPNPPMLKQSLFKVCMSACSVAQSCLTLATPWTVCSPPGSSVHGIFQARIRQWVPFLPPKDLSDPGIKPTSPALAGGLFITESPGKPTWLPPHSQKIKLMQSRWYLTCLTHPENKLY